ncbi:hypothetical protein HUU42_03005 [bacterium]|nr:hypothetical protein [bacterium]
MKIMFWMTAVGLLIITPSTNAQDEDENLYQFIVGRYQIIGRFPDSSDPYTGALTVSYENAQLTIVRNVNGKKINAVGKIVEAVDQVKVLRISFTEKSIEYDGTFLIKSDLDNYGRLSGYIYRRDQKTKSPGLEAWFIDHPDDQ